MEGDAATPITRLGTEERLDLGRDGREVLLDARRVGVTFKVEGGTVEAVRAMDFQVHRGETIAIVGESGSGKSVTARTVMRLLSKRAKIAEGDEDRPRRAGPPGLARVGRCGQLRGSKISMIFQEPMSSLNPVYTVGKQIEEVCSCTTASRGGWRRSGRWRCSRRCGSPSPRRGSSSIRTSSPAASGSG